MGKGEGTGLGGEMEIAEGYNIKRRIRGSRSKSGGGGGGHWTSSYFANCSSTEGSYLSFFLSCYRLCLKGRIEREHLITNDSQLSPLR